MHAYVRYIDLVIRGKFGLEERNINCATVLCTIIIMSYGSRNRLDIRVRMMTYHSSHKLCM